jgi:DNA-binding response OmpR family regulator
LARICKVLVVEDNRDIQDLLETVFSDEGYHFICVSDGASMRRVLATDEAVDVAIIDVMLPGREDGLALAGVAHEHGCGVIVVTGGHDHFARVEQSGHHFVLKPFRLQSLLAMVDEVLKETQARCEVKGREYEAP